MQVADWLCVPPPQNLPKPLLYLPLNLLQQAKHLLQAPLHLSKLRLTGVPISVAGHVLSFHNIFPMMVRFGPQMRCK